MIPWIKTHVYYGLCKGESIKFFIICLWAVGFIYFFLYRSLDWLWHKTCLGGGSHWWNGGLLGSAKCQLCGTPKYKKI